MTENKQDMQTKLTEVDQLKTEVDRLGGQVRQEETQAEWVERFNEKLRELIEDEQGQSSVFKNPLTLPLSSPFILTSFKLSKIRSLGSVKSNSKLKVGFLKSNCGQACVKVRDLSCDWIRSRKKHDTTKTLQSHRGSQSCMIVNCRLPFSLTPCPILHNFALDFWHSEHDFGHSETYFFGSQKIEQCGGKVVNCWQNRRTLLVIVASSPISQFPFTWYQKSHFRMLHN